jgi:hypothetical protein
MHLKQLISTKLCSTIALGALSLGAVACDEGQPAQPSLVNIAHGGAIFVATPNDGDDEPAVSERKGSCAPPQATTQPWEPGNGFFDIDESDPEHTVYYSTCPDRSDDLGIKSLYEVEVDPAKKELRRYSVHTFIPEGISLTNELGEPIHVGDRSQNGGVCTYSSSYVSCPDEVTEFNVGLFNPAIDATIVFESKSQHYWDYGQDRFRILWESSQRCEGADCDHPFVIAIIGQPVECSERGMTVYRRVPPPVFD